MLRLDVKVVLRQVAQKATWHGRVVTPSETEKKETAELHEKQEHNKDWKGFHDAHQKDVSNARVPTLDAAKAAAAAEQTRLRNEAQKAADDFNSHRDRSRWGPIEALERPH